MDMENISRIETNTAIHRAIETRRNRPMEMKMNSAARPTPLANTKAISGRGDISRLMAASHTEPMNTIKARKAKTTPMHLNPTSDRGGLRLAVVNFGDSICCFEYVGTSRPIPQSCFLERAGYPVGSGPLTARIGEPIDVLLHAEEAHEPREHVQSQVKDAGFPGSMRDESSSWPP